MTSHLEALSRRISRRSVARSRRWASWSRRRSAAASEPFSARDRQVAYGVILRDSYIDDAEKQIDQLCLRFLVRHQPAARLLRFAYASIRINLELERVGDYAEAIAREALRLSQIEAPLPL